MENNRLIVDTDTLLGGNYSLKDIQDYQSRFETFREWPSEIGMGHVNMIRLRPGLLLGIGNWRLKEHIEVNLDYTEASSPLQFGYIQSGIIDYTLQSKKNNQSLNYRQGQTMVSYWPDGRCVSRPPVGVNVCMIGIAVDPEILRSLMVEDLPGTSTSLSKFLNGSQRPFSHISNMLPETSTILNQVISCPYRGALKRLYLESKALELITCNIASLTGSVFKCETLFSKKDTDYIREAEFILKSNLENPPSLEELALQVGVNRTKLNQGFRKVFGTSVFDRLRILRLERARELLGNDHKRVSEVAFEVGYAHPENFARAFKRHFCTSPKDLLD